jgi:predicted amidophosphoribosyltransferase
LTLPLVTDAVFRVKETTSQVDLTRDERFRNLEDAFHGNSAKLKGKKVLLVDDIVTTGATLISCTQALLDSGCKSVFCITVAQTAKKHHQTL